MFKSFSLKPALFSGAVSCLALTAALPAHPQEILDIGEVVVTPNRTPTEMSKVGSSVDVVDEEKIEAQSLPVVVEYLQQIPGISFSSPGGRGQEGSLTLRGADKKYIKTLFNGIDISDPTSTQVQTSYQHLLAGGVDRIEVLKGPQSTLYGSDAVAGVIGVTTLGEIDPGLHHGITVEGGSHGTILSGYDLTGASETGRLAGSFYGLHSDGISAADEDEGNSELDSYRNFTASFAGEQALSENFSIFAAGLWIKARNELDAYSGFDPFAPIVDETNSFGKSEQLAGRVGFNLDLMEGRFRNTFAVQALDIKKLSHTETSAALSGYDDISDARFSGQRVKAQYQGTFEASEALTLIGGADYERLSAENENISTAFGSSSLNGSAWSSGVWTDAIWSPVENLALTGGLRHENHELFGGHTTWRTTAAYTFEQTGTKIRGALGTGFRAPSIYELYSPAPFAGNPDLQPETSVGWEVGIDQELIQDRLTASLTYFDLEIDNLIAYTVTDPVTFAGSYNQVDGTSNRRGVEAAIAYAATPWLDLGASYTYTHAANPVRDFSIPPRVVGEERAVRIPRHAFGFSVVARPAERWTVSATAKIALDAVDAVFTPSGRELTPLDDYVLVNAKLAYKPTDDTEVYLRVENLLDRDYQTVRGFGTPGLSAYAGFKAVF